MDFFTFLTQTVEGKNFTIAGVLLVVFFAFIALTFQYFRARKDDVAVTKTMLINQTGLVDTIKIMTDVNKEVSANISENTRTTAGLANIIDKLGSQIESGTALSGTIRDQLALDRTLIEAKLSKMPEEVAAAVTELFNQRDIEVDKAMLRDIKAYIRQESNRFRTGIMTLSASGDIITANDEMLELIGATPDILGKNIIKDDILRVVSEGGTPLIAESSPFYYALSNVASIKDIFIGVFNNVTQDFSWFSLKINPVHFLGTTTTSHFLVTLTSIGNMVKRKDNPVVSI